MNELTQYLGKS